MENKYKKLYASNLLTWMENSEFIIAMRRGLLLCVPFLLIGSFCIVLTSFPVPIYQEWIRSLFNGAIFGAILWVHNATMGSVTLFVILSISYNYGNQMDSEELGFYMFTSIASYIVFAEENLAEISFTIFSATWLFTGIIVTLVSCYLFRKFYALSKARVKKRYQTGVDMDFHNTVLVIAPVVGVIGFFVLLKLLLLQTVGINIQNLGSFAMLRLFERVGGGLLGSILFIFLIHILWFFGIHGSNMLSMVSVKIFESGMVENMEAVANGGEATHIFTKTFFDVFVLMGGSGATLCLLLALLLRKRKKDKTLFKLSIVPALFNINEIVLYGLPVVFNPIMLIPFVMVPLAILLVSTIAVYFGLVPIPMVQVGWTTPVLFSGYLSTGSIAGAVLQLVSLGVGTVIYLPFIKISEHYYDRLLQKNIENIKIEMLDCEQQGQTIDFTTGSRSKRDIVKMLTKDLRTALQNDDIMLFYQPQVKGDQSVYGVEALLRWKHPVAGFLYPPLVIELARQDNLLDELGVLIIDKAARNLEIISKKVKEPIHMAVNISPVQFENDSFCKQVKAILEKYDFGECVLCFEVTEQLALSTTGVISNRIEELREAGIPFHMDDFGMGHSSMTYLQSNEFEVVKLDGSLVRQILDNNRSKEIISGIQNMSLSLNYQLIAEYVENQEQREILKDLGCDIYQGSLYSMPIPMDELQVFLGEYNAYK